jgi:hypothetical protein
MSKLDEQKKWEALAEHQWQRVKWRRTDGLTENECCCVYGTPIHREGTYYLRPAYTDGKRWMCQQAYREMCRQVGMKPSNHYNSVPKDSNKQDSSNQEQKER